MRNEVILGLMEVIDMVVDMDMIESAKDEIIGAIHNQVMQLA